jgi:PAS domain-containing protein
LVCGAIFPVLSVRVKDGRGGRPNAGRHDRWKRLSHPVTTRDGEKRWVAFTLAPLGEWSTPAFLITLNDITGYKQREDALRQSELRYKTVFNMAPDMFSIYDVAGPVIDLNEAAFELFGLTREEAVHKTGIMTQLCEEEQARFVQIREDPFKHGEWRGQESLIMAVSPA